MCFQQFLFGGPALWFWPECPRIHYWWKLLAAELNVWQAADGCGGSGRLARVSQRLNALGSHVGPCSAVVQHASLCLFLGQRLRWGKAVLKACECAGKSHAVQVRASFYKHNLWLWVRVISISPLSIRNVSSCGRLSKTGWFVPSISNLFSSEWVSVCSCTCNILSTKILAIWGHFWKERTFWPVLTSSVLSLGSKCLRSWLGLGAG